MCDVNVSCLISQVDPAELSGSIAERGQNAGKETWNNSLVAATQRKSLVKPSDRDSVRKYFAGFGAWDEAEIAGWSNNELNAMVLQYAAGDLREVQSICPGDGLADVDWECARNQSEDGVIAGRLFVHDGGLYINLDE